ncbi:uncharacterized protein LOC131682418 [Topomyia yanbarensis]|uniref:uncharacterized protein LOC131682418 n=1 Tax=Topomyia yanbarensis TaxID=2498891 RepID=UPI00273B3ED8|nr:uncharacterized protein LOC131682418 [Topomyia yanbarensis]XP_058819850.1 uncharacterized protein LOC131682418 [Topomyia yanbarensis]
MALGYEIEPVRSARSNSESDYDMVSDAGSIEIINEGTGDELISGETVPLASSSRVSVADSSGAELNLDATSPLDAVQTEDEHKDEPSEQSANENGEQMQSLPEVVEQENSEMDEFSSYEIVAKDSASPSDAGYSSEEQSMPIADQRPADICCRLPDTAMSRSCEIAGEQTHSNSQSEQDNDQLNKQAQPNEAHSIAVTIGIDREVNEKSNSLANCDAVTNGEAEGSSKQFVNDESDTKDNLDDQKKVGHMQTEQAAIEEPTEAVEKILATLSLVGATERSEKPISDTKMNGSAVEPPQQSEIDELGVKDDLEEQRIIASLVAQWLATESFDDDDSDMMMERALAEQVAEIEEEATLDLVEKTDEKPKSDTKMNGAGVEPPQQSEIDELGVKDDLEEQKIIASLAAQGLATQSFDDDDSDMMMERAFAEQVAEIEEEDQTTLDLVEKTESSEKPSSDTKMNGSGVEQPQTSDIEEIGVTVNLGERKMNVSIVEEWLDTYTDNDQDMLMERAVEVEEEELPTLHSVGKFFYGGEQIKLKYPSPMRVDQLGLSARITYENLRIKLHNEGSLMSADDNFLAKVELVALELLEDTLDFFEAKEVLLQNLRIVKVLQDDLTAGRSSHQAAFLADVKQALTISTVDDQFALNCIQLSNILSAAPLPRLNRERLCHEIANNSVISHDLKQSAGALNAAENTVLCRNRLLARFGFPQTDPSDTNLLKGVKQMLDLTFANYNNMLLEKAPKHLHDSIQRMSKRRILLIRNNDIKLFTDLCATLNEDIFQMPLIDLGNRWIANVTAINVKKTRHIAPQTNPIYFFLCKSLEELIFEISGRTDHLPKDLLTSDSSGWHPIKKINWKSVSALTKCLEREYYFLFKLLKHFELGASASQKLFEYKVKLFEGPTQKPMWKRVVVGTKKLFGINETIGNSLNIADEFYVWYCLLDDVLAHALPDDCQLDCFGTIIQSYVDFLRGVGHDQLETLRVITHNTARFVVQTMPYVTLKDSSLIDRQILQKQLDLINSKATSKTLSSNHFRDLVDVFNSYWKNREDIISTIPSKIQLPEMTSLRDRLLEIVLVALEKNVSAEDMVTFFRAYSDLLVDLNDVQFDWFVKMTTSDNQTKSFVDLDLIKPVENKWSNTANVTYCVINPEKYSKLWRIIFDNIAPSKHYVIEVLSSLLSFINLQLNKAQWKSGEMLSQTTQICTTNELIFAVRNSFLYLLEQPEYVSFELFYDERVKPFASAMDNSRSHRDFTNRIYLIKESFWYIRKQNEMDVDGALELFRELNNATEDQLLRKAYQQYCQSFQQFMQLTEEEHTEKARKIADEVSILATKAPFKQWTDTYKQEKLPEILAGLAAVWSVLVSKDVSGTGKYLTPHCIQILCILRLLSVDRAEEGVTKHLSQVLTGQGKSLVLGLTAGLFALTGHKPRIVCYNHYLVERDESDFKQFYAIFNINNIITYSTYDAMANELIAPIVDGRRMGLRDLMSVMLLKDAAPVRSKFVSEDCASSVLLIDEVDVFFTKEYYGGVYCPVNRLMLPGLDKIQEKIWSIVIGNPLLTYGSIEQSISDYIKSPQMAAQNDFHKFLASTKSYDLLIYKEGKVLTERFTNRSLFENHLRQMIACAIDVVSSPADRWMDYKLSNTGTILHKYRGQFVNYNVNSYYMVFNYFRLRKSDFSIRVALEVNYGYLNLDCGSISYAMLPQRYPLILGVTGTLTSLNQHEKTCIRDLYDIRDLSAMPTFFGCSNLRFDPVSDFQQLPSQSEWLNAIFSRANAVLGAKRSVLVFFESDLQLNQFHAEYSGQFDRLNILTENTDAKQTQQFIDEAGVAKTITLATRGMGRGVDYKSSVSIEKHGGLHVIQTFFSLDVKEEVQIKGRTARKDNRGSYELIVCQGDLEKIGLLWKVCQVNYYQLDGARQDLALKENERILDAIVRRTNDHDVTMQYMKTFFTN